MVRRAEQSEYALILEIYAYAREFMREHGNPTQWGENKPSPEQLQEDIRSRNLYVIERGGVICGSFYFHIGDDPTYAEIREGAWPETGEYGVIHRIAGAKGAHGIVSEAVRYAACQIDCLRIDTHRDNKVMQGAVERCGFVRCGIITTDDGTDRIAYQRDSAASPIAYTDRLSLH